MKNIYIILLLIIICFSCLQRKQAVIPNNPLYSYIDSIVNETSQYRHPIEKIENYCLKFIKTNLDDTLFIFSYCSSNFPNEQIAVGYKGIIKINDLNIFIFDEHELGIKFYGDSLQIKELPVFKSYEYANWLILGYLDNNNFRDDMELYDIDEKGWWEYFE